MREQKIDCLKIAFLDVLTIRDGKPFDLGADYHAMDVWPVSPWTVLGAIRALTIESLGVSARDYGKCEKEAEEVIEKIGAPDSAPKFSLGPALLLDRKGNILFPLPADIVTYSQTQEVKRLVAKKKEFFKENGYIFSFDDEKRKYIATLPLSQFHPSKSSTLDFLCMDELKQWLEGKAPEINKPFHKEAEALIKNEIRTGIKINPDSGSAEEKYFYTRSVRVVAPDCCLIIPIIEDFTGFDIIRNLKGNVRFGGDGHIALIEPFDITMPSSGGNGKKAALYFLSPVHPDSIDGNHIGSMIGGAVNVEMVVAGKPVSLGGWNLCSSKFGPRRMRQYYPAGSVVFISVENGGDARNLHCKSIAKDSDERSAGFAFCMVGAWSGE